MLELACGTMLPQQLIISGGQNWIRISLANFTKCTGLQGTQVSSCTHGIVGARYDFLCNALRYLLCILCI